MVKFRFKRKSRSAISVALIASASFLALAVWGWGMALSTLVEYFLILCVLMFAVIMLAALSVGMVKLLKKSFNRGNGSR